MDVFTAAARFSLINRARIRRKKKKKKKKTRVLGDEVT